MKTLIILILVTVLLSLNVFSQPYPEFEEYFIDKTMRIDFFHIGNAKDEFITLDKIYQYGIWAGSRKNLIDSFNNGRYYAKIYDRQTGRLIYSKGFDSYFGEYKTTDDGLRGVNRAYHETILAPYPRDRIIFNLERRDNSNILHTFYSDTIDPKATEIIRHEFIDPAVEVYKIIVSGNPHRKADVVILAEGYTIAERDKFKSDAERVANVFFDQEPYRSRMNDFNFYAVFKPSPDSGVDEPRAGKFKQTTFSATFNSLGSERYLLTEDNKTMRDLAAQVPYDAIYIMVNHKRYGGGGIYNLFCTFTVDNQWTDYLLIHEFGHSFAGLADEYYSSDVAYNDFFPDGVEPVEPNITALLDPSNLKWKALQSEGVEIPTPWGKEIYDGINFSWQKLRKKMNDKIAELKRNEAPDEEIKAAEAEYRKKDREEADKMDEFIIKNPFIKKVGAFEGAGYSSTGLYRPMLDCIMFSKGDKPYCRVCEQAIEKVINQYLEL